MSDPGLAMISRQAHMMATALERAVRTIIGFQANGINLGGTHDA
jgi:hypothetical protein